VCSLLGVWGGWGGGGGGPPGTLKIVIFVKTKIHYSTQLSLLIIFLGPYCFPTTKSPGFNQLMELAYPLINIGQE
jgi:hypothetical protein